MAVQKSRLSDISQKAFNSYTISVYSNSSFNFYNALLVVVSALLACAMRLHKSTAVAAFNQGRSCHFPVSSSLISVAFR